MTWDEVVDIAACAHARTLAHVFNCLVRPQSGLGEMLLFHDGRRFVWDLD